jgi:S-adenosylmethionine:tRNA ribosyltransferase-isomerase
MGRRAMNAVACAGDRGHVHAARHAAPPAIAPAPWPRDDPRATRMLHIDPRHGAFADRSVGDMPGLLRRGDVLVVNDAATLPASLHGRTASGQPIEVRLAGTDEAGAWRAVVFGGGDWRMPTEHRPPPPAVRTGERLRFDGLDATVTSVEGARVVSLAFRPQGGALWRALYRTGRPVQYAYMVAPLALWHVQTGYAARPWGVEAPSAGLALSWELLLGLRGAGITLARVTHAAGLSSTGDELLDAALPLPERYDVPAGTVDAIREAKARGDRVVAVGTTTTRALEGAAAGGALSAGMGVTSLRLGADTPRRVVDGILTGVHEADMSHFALLEAFAPHALLRRAHVFARARGYLGHEFGDAVLILSRPAPTRDPNAGISSSR